MRSHCNTGTSAQPLHCRGQSGKRTELTLLCQEQAALPRSAIEMDAPGAHAHLTQACWCRHGGSVSQSKLKGPLCDAGTSSAPEEVLAGAAQASSFETCCCDGGCGPYRAVPFCSQASMSVKLDASAH
jgi:hypothetical protein